MRKLTKSAMYGDMADPTFPAMLHTPSVQLRALVGNNSEVYTNTVAKAPDTPSLPMNDRVNVIQERAEIESLA